VGHLVVIEGEVIEGEVLVGERGWYMHYSPIGHQSKMYVVLTARKP
jgi:hypothetical protein